MRQNVVDSMFKAIYIRPQISRSPFDVSPFKAERSGDSDVGYV